MHRIFAQRENLTSDQVVVWGDDAWHMHRVLRMAVGDQFVVVDPQGQQWTAEVEEIEPQYVSGRLLQHRAGTSEAPINVTLAAAILKGDKMDLVVQKATELGVGRIIPVICQRSIARIPAQKIAQRTQRWQRIALNAAMQSQRCAVPEVTEPCSLASVLEGETATSLLAYEGEGQTGVSAALPSFDEHEITLYTGPEGGFTSAEVGMARGRGAVTVGLGPRVLRAETAALTLLTLVMFRWGDVGNPTHPFPDRPDMPDESPE